MRERLHIGEVAALVGVSPKTIRYYHEVGLLAEPERTDVGYRLYTACIVWGSAFDLDINQVAEGAMQSLMQEELPVTPRRLQLLGLSFLLLAGMILLILKLPVVLSILALVLLDGVVHIGLWRFGLFRLKRLITSALF